MDPFKRMKKMIANATEMLVWVATRPCVMVLPPHCFHTVMTFSLSCHSGIRLGSNIWNNEMKSIIKCITDPKVQDTVDENRKVRNSLMNTTVEDTRLWCNWAANLNRAATEEESRVLEILDDVFGIVESYFVQYCI